MPRPRIVSGRWIECVPNISEGRDAEVIDEIVDSARGFHGSAVLSAEPDADYNRTVITIAGQAESVTQAAISLIRKSAELIDMRLHSGSHPRMGAVDVCPFVPLAEGTHGDCMASAASVMEAVGDDIPVYLYGDAATSRPRAQLAKLPFQCPCRTLPRIVLIEMYDMQGKVNHRNPPQIEIHLGHQQL